MSIDQPFNVYRDQLTSQYHGTALWDPNPVEGLYDCGRVSIGDVGYLDDGNFIRMFNVTLPWNNPSNAKLGIPNDFSSLEQGRVRSRQISQTEYHSPYVSKEDNTGNFHARIADEARGHTYKCRAQSHGALLSLPHGGRREDVIHKKAFKDYIRSHVVSWFTWAGINNLDVERMEDLILVTGCTWATSWAAAALDDRTTPVDGATVSLDAQKLHSGRAQFFWRTICGNVEYHNSIFDSNNEQPLPQNQCVFIRGFRAKRILFRTQLQAAAEPLPDNPDNSREDEIQVTRIPDVSNHRDPLTGVLDYIVQKCLEDGTADDLDIIAIAHDDDLRLIGDVETLTADTIEEFLRREQVPLLVEDGAAILNMPDWLRCAAQHWLSPPDASKNHRILCEAHHTGTSSWFFKSDEFTKWKKTGSMLWIHGKPGSGKSTLLSAIIQDIEGMSAAGLAIMAYFYFDFRDVKKQDLYGLLSSLVLQLSSLSDSCFSVLSQLHSDHSNGKRKPDIYALKKCMTDMLTLPGQAPIYLIVDALDECPNLSGSPTAREEVLELIEGLVDLKLPNVHLCVASRPEMDIRMVLGPLTSLKISLHDESGQKEDIIAYIKHVVRSDPKMRRWKEEDRKLVIDTLSEKADGMFRWVTCQADSLRCFLPARIRSVLNDFSEALDEIYIRALLSIDEEKREYAQRLFQCLAVSIRPLRVEELAEILAVRFDETMLPTFNAAWRPENPEEAVISACSSLITVVDTGGCRIVKFSHFSVKEFLTSERLATEERLSYYHILPESAHTILANASLSVLLQLDDKSDRSTINHFPLAPYAARHWVDHAQYRNVSSHIQKVMERLFDAARPHFSSWVWLYDIDCHWIEPMSTIHPTRPEAVPLYYAALSGFHGLVEHLIAADSRDVNSRGGFHTTPLHAASVKGHFDVASVLLETGADPNSRDHLGRAPLHRVSQGGRLVMVESSLRIARLLVNFGADVDVTDDDGGTPLHAAARSGYRDIAELLVESGATLDGRNKQQEIPLHVACGFGKVDVSRFLIDRGSDMKSRDKNGLIPLHTASRFGHVDVARLLLDCGCDMDVRSTRRWTPLLYASRFGYFDLSQLLMDRGADLNVHEDCGSTALHTASASGHLDIARLLILRGAEVDSQDNEKRTPLYHAASFGHLDIARLLVEWGAAVSSRDYEGWTPFHGASYSGHLYVTKLLLECGIHVDIRNGWEQTPLYLASESGSLDVVRFLIEHGADIHTIDDSGRNPLHIASQNGHLDVVRLLTNTGNAVHIRNGTQMTPLALASSKGKVEVGRILIEKGADINARDIEGWAPLHFASRYGHLDMARLLLDHDADVNIQCDGLWSPLHLASASWHLNITELLVQRGAIVDIFSNKQTTPLDHAVFYGKVAIARFLIDHGANLHSTDSNGWTPLHFASYTGHLGVVKLLLRHGAEVDVVNRDNKPAAELASENGKAEVAKLISEYKADANIRNKTRSTTLDLAQYGADEDGGDEGKASLHVAAKEGNIDVVKSLLDRGIDTNDRNAGNQTPLHIATNPDVVRLLIERGAEVDSRDEWGWTPLHQASLYGHLQVSRVLLDHGANVNARNSNHWTPIHLSAAVGIVKLLLERGADVHALNGDGETPYQVSLAHGFRDVADLLRKHGADRTSFNENAAW